MCVCENYNEDKNSNFFDKLFILFLEALMKLSKQKQIASDINIFIILKEELGE